MTNDQKIAVLERMRELLADPDRVVLDPLHYFEIEDGTVIECGVAEARLRSQNCRVCFCGAASMAAFELTADKNNVVEVDEQICDVVASKLNELDVPFEPAAVKAFGHSRVGYLTSALMQGRAVEVVDACLADLHSVAA